jgi:hypothetical protein
MVKIIPINVRMANMPKTLRMILSILHPLMLYLARIL